MTDALVFADQMVGPTGERMPFELRSSPRSTLKGRMSTPLASPDPADSDPHGHVDTSADRSAPAFRADPPRSAAAAKHLVGTVCLEDTLDGPVVVREGRRSPLLLPTVAEAEIEPYVQADDHAV